MSQKRKRVVSMETKFAVLKKIDERVPQTRLADLYGIGWSNITYLKKNKSKIREFVSILDDA